MSDQDEHKVSLLERAKIQADVLLPVLNRLRSELGDDQANAIVYESLREWSRQKFEARAMQIQGSPTKKWQQLTVELIEDVGDDVEFQITREEPSAIDYDIHSCRYAQFFLELGEPELGTVLVCESDYHIADIGSPDVQFSRGETIMDGSKLCDFRYTFGEDK